MSTAPDVYPRKVTECYVTSDGMLHASAAAADIAQSKINADLAEAERLRVQMEAFQKEQHDLRVETGLIRTLCMEYDTQARSLYRDHSNIRPERFAQILRDNGYKITYRH